MYMCVIYVHVIPCMFWTHMCGITDLNNGKLWETDAFFIDGKMLWIINNTKINLWSIKMNHKIQRENVKIISCNIKQVNWSLKCRVLKYTKGKIL